MKKIIFSLAMMLGLSSSVNAQSDSKMAVGVNVNAGMGDSYTNYGLGAKFQYNFAEHWRGEASFNYFFEKEYVSMWDINVDAHYLINTKNVTIYPLAGITMRAATASIMGFSTTDTNIGVNYGAGVDFKLSDSFKLNLEIKGVTTGGGWGTRGMFSVGAAYCF